MAETMGVNFPNTTGGYGLLPLGPSGIVMDTSKAMAILGFSSSQTFDATSMEEINRAFMHKLHILLRPPPEMKGKNPRAQKKIADTRKQEIRRLNEALQCLIRKRTKSRAIEEWKFGRNRGLAVTLALQALDEQAALLRNEDFRAEQKRYEMERKAESKRAQDLAQEIVASIEGTSEDKHSRNNSIKKKKRGSVAEIPPVVTEELGITKTRVFSSKLPSRTYQRRDSPGKPGKLRKSDLTSSNPDLSGYDDDDTKSVIDIENFDEMQSTFLQMNLNQVEEILHNLNQALD